MKHFHSIPKALTGAFVLVALFTPALAWRQEPREVTGWYWGYDTEEEGPPFAYPELPPLPEFVDITTIGTKLEPVNDEPYPYVLEDSFWFYNYWYVPGDTLYLSPDGWVSFDESAEAGFPYPPTALPFPYQADPNALIAPLWQDNDPTLTEGDGAENRVYYHYDPEDRILSVEWYMIQGAAWGDKYTYMTTLQLGGQELLIEDCNIFFSSHFIHFLYDSANDWMGENPATGIEDLSGDRGIFYPPNVVADGRVLRIGYRVVPDHDVAAIEIVVPKTFVEAGVDVEPRVLVCNVGKETETFNAALSIYDEEPKVIYHDLISGYTLPGNSYPDTLIFPYWTSGDSGEHYVAELITSLDGDQCPANDTLTKHIWSGAGISENRPSLQTSFEFHVSPAKEGCAVIFSNPYLCSIEIVAYDLNGRRVRTLADETFPAGSYTLFWDGLDSEGRKVAQGVYLVRMEAGGWKDTRKVIIVN